MRMPTIKIHFRRHQFHQSSFKRHELFSNISGLHPKFTKCEIAGIVVLKSVNVTLCGMKYLDLTKKCINVLGEHISRS